MIDVDAASVGGAAGGSARPAAGAVEMSALGGGHHTRLGSEGNLVLLVAEDEPGGSAGDGPLLSAHSRAHPSHLGTSAADLSGSFSASVAGDEPSSTGAGGSQGGNHHHQSSWGGGQPLSYYGPGGGL